MKTVHYLLGVALIVIAASCNNQSSDSNKSKEMGHEQMKMDTMKMDTMQMNNMKMDSTHHNKHQMMDSLKKE